MSITTIISHLKTYCPSFSNRVAGAARFKMIDETTMLDVPHAFVIPLDDNPDGNRALNSIRQGLTESFSVVVALSNLPDERGQSAIYSAHETIRAELWKALLGWQPDGLGAASRYEGCVYQGGNLLGLDRARLWYQFDFGAYMEINIADTWQAIELAALPHLDAVDINIDVIDPIADPNLEYPGPDGRIEHVIKSPKTGILP